MNGDLGFQVVSDEQSKFEKEILEILKENNEIQYETLKKRLEDVSAESKLKIAFVGQHNAGKSTIVSALTKNQSIKISSNVETDVTSSYEWGDVILYDTPGLFAGVKESHDQEAMEAIGDSDILVFSITSSLFDDLLIKDFVDLAYKRAYRNKIILVVNKMSQEDGEFDELKQNYYKTLKTTLSEQGGDIEDFPLAFIDAKDYKDGLADEDEELVELSNFEDFIELLNIQIATKGLYAKIATRCNIISDLISEEIANTGTELDKNMMTILNRLSKTIRRYKKEMEYKFECSSSALRNGIMGIGDSLISKIGVEEITKEDCEKVNSEVNKCIEDNIEIIENNLSNIESEMAEDIGGILTSDIGNYVFREINSTAIGEKKGLVAKDYSEMLDKFGAFADAVGKGGAKVAGMALKEGAKDFTKLASTSGSTMHQIVLKVGHFFGKTFKPWEAIKTAQILGKVASYAGPVLSVVDVALAVGGKIAEEGRIQKVNEAKDKSYNNFSSIASDALLKLNSQFEEMSVAVFDSKQKEIDKIKEDMVQKAESNSEYVNILKQKSVEVRELLNQMANE